MLEQVADFNDELMGLILEEEQVDPDLIIKAIRAGAGEQNMSGTLRFCL